MSVCHSICLLIRALFRNRVELAVENLALRQQLGFSDIGHTALRSVDPEDYLNAVCGSIDTARDELTKLQKLLNGKPEGGAS